MKRKGKSFLKRVFVKQAASFLAAALFLGILSACGGTEDPVQGSGKDSPSTETPQGEEDMEDDGIYDIVSDTEEAIALGEETHGTLKSAQYYQGEPVVLAAVRSAGATDIYLYRWGGEKELLRVGLPSDVYIGRSFLDEESDYYHIQEGWGKEPTVITKYDSSGKKVYAITREGSELQICGLPEGIIALYYRDNATGQGKLELLNAGTGTSSPVQLKKAPEYNTYLGTDGKDLFFMDTAGISRIDLTEGGTAMYLSFAGTSYSVPPESLAGGLIKTFRVNGNRETKILWERSLSPDIAASMNLPLYTVLLETLRKEKPDAEKTILTLRGLSLEYDTWLKERIAEFNRTNGSYYVVVEENDGSVSDEDYITRTGVELGAGQGPDILYGDGILDRSLLYSLTQKGALEELTPYMERTGIRREDYFPAAFCSFGNEGKVYGINTCILMRMGEIIGSLPEEAGSTDIHDFVDALLTLGDQALYNASYDSYDLLQAFLEGSDSLWGMVDWERGVCNLDEEFFPKLLQVAKNLGRDDRKSYEPISKNMLLVGLLNLDKLFNSQAIGWPFDDGFYGKISTDWSLKINANSRHKEGAWEFISHLLSRETQEAMNDVPVYKEAITAQAERYAQDVAVKKRPKDVLLTEEDLAAVTPFLEEKIRFRPVRNQPLIDIILDGAQDYFNGIKDIPQVMDVIENRLNLYLQETTR